jgi:hypothetical protein
MNFIKQVVLVIMGAALFQYFLPWWSLVIPALVIGFMFARSGVEAFFSALIGIGLLWLGMALYIDATTGSMLSQKIASLFPGKSIWVLRLITVLVGGLTGGFAALAGYSIKPLR